MIKSYSRCEVKIIDFGSSCFVTDNGDLLITREALRLLRRRLQDVIAALAAFSAAEWAVEAAVAAFEGLSPSPAALSPPPPARPERGSSRRLPPAAAAPERCSGWRSSGPPGESGVNQQGRLGKSGVNQLFNKYSDGGAVDDLDVGGVGGVAEDAEDGGEVGAAHGAVPP